MKKNHFLFVLISVGVVLAFLGSGFARFSVKPAGPLPSEMLLETILNRVYDALGNVNVAKPSILQTSENRNIAMYYRRSNRIEVDEKLVQICQGMGDAGHDALAFVIGHELQHAIKDASDEDAHFLAHYRTNGSTARSELDADVAGAFSAYQAGYRQTLAVLPNLLEKIYTAYRLKDTELPGYPSLEERKRTSMKVVDYTRCVIELFELGNYLVALGKYEAAAQIYEQILPVYHGSVVHNNLGVCRTLQAFYLSDPPSDPYLFPLELGSKLPLRIPELSRGTSTLGPEYWKKRSTLLTTAESSFRQALRLQPTDMKSQINLACALIMNGKTEEAMRFIHGQNLMGKTGHNPEQAEKVRLTLALAEAYLSHPSAMAHFQALRDSRHQLVRQIAQYNHAILTGQTPPFSASCDIPDGMMPKPGKLNEHPQVLKKMNTYPLAGPSPYQLSYAWSGESAHFSLRHRDKVLFVAQKMRHHSAFKPGPNKKVLDTDDGYIGVCIEKQFAYTYNEHKKAITEWLIFKDF
jgi:tetratricopeptide (TPR) repeat protein